MLLSMAGVERLGRLGLADRSEGGGGKPAAGSAAAGEGRRGGRAACKGDGAGCS